MLDYLFETSWEVCNKVGGIYAVLSTKAKTLQQQHKDRVFFIGPDLWTEAHPSPFFANGRTPLDRWVKQATLPCGIRARVGRWNVPGRPIAVLVDYKGLYERKNEFYGEMWEHFGVDSIHGYGDYDDSCMFACASALVIENVIQWLNEPEARIVAHFDEWTTGMGLLYVKSHLPQVATVFTTHATSIGRSICGNGKPLYDYLKGYNGDQMAGELNMQSKHSLEKAAAHAADVFTTVSEVTARECSQLLERRPWVTPNAFEAGFVPRGKAMDAARAAARAKLLALAKALTGTTYAADTMLVGTSGRCEFRNKGLDVLLDGLNVARTALAEAETERRVVAFVLVPSWVDGARPDIARAVETGKTVKEPGLPVSHLIHKGYHDVILEKMRAVKFLNLPTDLLHVIYVPQYLNGDDGVLNLSYYDLLCGLDLTVFPSYYEPWGYTPLESVAFGVPTITTDLAGFGQWILDEMGDNRGATGVDVIHRDDSNYHDAVHAVAKSLVEFSHHTPERRAMISCNARATAAMASWRHFIRYYNEAYEAAIRMVGDR